MWQQNCVFGTIRNQTTKNIGMLNLGRVALRVPRRRLGIASSMVSAPRLEDRNTWDKAEISFPSPDPPAVQSPLGEPVQAVDVSPPPKWSFHGRPLPQNLISLSSPKGRRIFKETLNGSENMVSVCPLWLYFAEFSTL